MILFEPHQRSERVRNFILRQTPKSQIFIIVFGTILVAFIASISMHFIFFTTELESKIPLITSIYTVLGTIYAVLIAFFVSGVWQNYCATEQAVTMEVAALVDLVHLLSASHFPKISFIHNLVITYIKTVIATEWPLLTKGQHDLILSTEGTTFKLSTQLTHEVQSLEPTNARENIMYSHMLTLLTKWLDARRARIVLSKGNIAQSLWPLLIAGAIILFAFHGLFIVHNKRLWLFLLFFFSGIIGVAFYLIFTLDAPFSGNPSVKATPFSWALTLLSHQPLDS